MKELTERERSAIRCTHSTPMFRLYNIAEQTITMSHWWKNKETHTTVDVVDVENYEYKWEKSGKWTL